MVVLSLPAAGAALRGRMVMSAGVELCGDATPLGIGGRSMRPIAQIDARRRRRGAMSTATLSAIFVTHHNMERLRRRKQCLRGRAEAHRSLSLRLLAVLAADHFAVAVIAPRRKRSTIVLRVLNAADSSAAASAMTMTVAMTMTMARQVRVVATHIVILLRVGCHR